MRAAFFVKVSHASVRRHQAMTPGVVPVVNEDWVCDVGAG